MAILEILQFSILSILLAYVSISDIKYGIVKNSRLIIFAGMGLLCIIPYYMWFGIEYRVLFLVNLVITIIIGCLFYAMGIWGAGDSKLLFVVMLLFPARIYGVANYSVAVSFLLILLIFVVAFLYIVGETVYVGIKQKDLFKLTRKQFGWKGNVKSVLFLYFSFLIYFRVISMLFPLFYSSDKLLFTALQFCLMLVAIEIEKKVSWTTIIIISCIGTLLFIIETSAYKSSTVASNWGIYILAILLILFRSMAAKYNYKSIPITDLKPGMILSVGSSMLFYDSKNRGLPSISREDMWSRLSADEVESIRQWSKQNSEREMLVIVRKIPFALFIAIGTCLFTLLEVLI